MRKDLFWLKSLKTAENLQSEAEVENLSVIKDRGRKNDDRLPEADLFLVGWFLTVCADGNKV